MAPSDRLMHYCGFTIPKHGLPAMKKALRQWPSSSGPYAPVQPAWWMWHLCDGGDDIVLLIAAEDALIYDDMEGKVFDLLHEWVMHATNEATAHLKGHRYTHVAPANLGVWERLRSMADSIHEKHGRTVITIGRVVGHYFEFPFGHVVSKGPVIAQRASCALIAPREAGAELRRLIGILQEGADHYEANPPKPVSPVPHGIDETHRLTSILGLTDRYFRRRD